MAAIVQSTCTDVALITMDSLENSDDTKAYLEVGSSVEYVFVAKLTTSSSVIQLIVQI
jgi:hypothetical protein